MVGDILTRLPFQGDDGKPLTNVKGFISNEIKGLIIFLHLDKNYIHLYIIIFQKTFNGC